MDTGDAGTPMTESRRGSAPLRKVFANRATWLIALASMMIGMVRRSTIDSWYPKFFKEIYITSGARIWLTRALPGRGLGDRLLGIAGGFAFGIASDRRLWGQPRAR